MKRSILRINETDSTNRFLREYRGMEDVDLLVAMTDFQTAGKGQGENHWESEAAKNLLFSIKIQPKALPASKQYMISMVTAIAIHEVLRQIAGNFTIKWPNDIYWKDRKVSGTLIETRYTSNGLKDVIIGVGINVNQEVFTSQAPNPASLRHITGETTDREELLEQVLEKFQKHYQKLLAGQYAEISDQYHQWLYRKDEWNTYIDKNGRFTARIVKVNDNGQLVLEDESGKLREYMFKEIEFYIKTNQK